VNEVLTGLRLDMGTAERRPRVAIIPAGGTNVVARALGFPNHPERALDALIAGIANDARRRVTVGALDERRFLFSAGVGLDGELVRRMEERRSGRRPSDAAHLAALVSIYATSRFSLGDRMTVAGEYRLPDAGTFEQRAALAFIGNTNPMTYMGRLPVQFMPTASFELGLDILAPTRANLPTTLVNAVRALGVGRARRPSSEQPRSPLHHDLARITLTCDEPESVQVDGEYVGRRTHITCTALESAIDLVAPPESA
jgi:diacylglycerol kinase family enzyme